jgi:TetR/AcrR family transcriptional regulator, mexJK operon transcriptional repressor
MPLRPDTTTAADDDAGERSGVRRQGGRPSRADAARLGDRILDVATGLFLANGYGATSIEDIARAARISKRTLYHRYADKRELFGAVITRIVEGLRPANADSLFVDQGPLEEALLRLAHAILRAALSPQAVALYRVIVAEAARFPDIAAVIAQQGRSQAAVAQIAALLAHHDAVGWSTAEAREFAAAQFLQMVMAAPLRRALGLGEPLTAPELDAWARNTVALFLNGYRGAAGRTV